MCFFLGQYSPLLVKACNYFFFTKAALKRQLRCLFLCFRGILVFSYTHHIIFRASKKSPRKSSFVFFSYSVLKFSSPNNGAFPALVSGETLLIFFFFKSNEHFSSGMCFIFYRAQLIIVQKEVLSIFIPADPLLCLPRESTVQMYCRIEK